MWNGQKYRSRLPMATTTLSFSSFPFSLSPQRWDATNAETKPRFAETPEQSKGSLFQVCCMSELTLPRTIRLWPGILYDKMLPFQFIQFHFSFSSDAWHKQWIRLWRVIFDDFCFVWAPVCVICDTVIKVKHNLIECTDFSGDWKEIFWGEIFILTFSEH